MTKKIAVVGLDGATFDLIEPWVAQGKLPTFKKLMEGGAWGRMKTTEPPFTPCAWSSFMTGKNPGKHGQFSFYKLNETWGLDIDWSEYRSEDNIWQIISREGKRCCIINVPLTYPPHKLNGYMVSGFTTPSIKSSFTYPQALKQDLLENIPEFRIAENSRYTDRKEDKRRFARDIVELTEIHEKVASYLIEKEAWDFFMITFMATDHIQHWYWKYMDESHPDYEFDKEFQDKILEIYTQIDGVLDRLIQGLSEDTTLFLMSDHGAGKYVGDVDINQWLKEKNYLRLRRSPAVLLKGLLYALGITQTRLIDVMLKIGFGRLSKPSPSQTAGLVRKILDVIGYTWSDVNWRRTKAYSFGYYGSIFINLKGRGKYGSVEPEEYEELRDEIIGHLKLLEVPSTGTKLVNDIWKREELYWGPKADKFPDISFCMSNYSYATASMLAFPSGKVLQRCFHLVKYSKHLQM